MIVFTLVNDDGSERHDLAATERIDALTEAMRIAYHGRWHLIDNRITRVVFTFFA